MATVDFGLGEGSRATVTGVDRNNDGIPDVLQQGTTVLAAAPVVQSANLSYSPAPAVRPARVIPPQVTSSWQEGGGVRTAPNVIETVEYAAVEKEEVDQYVCGPAQFQGKLASMVSVGMTPTPPLMRSPAVP